MKRSAWQHSVLCTALVASTSFALSAQNATTGGDQQSQPDAQGSTPQNAPQRGPGGAGGGFGGNRGGTIRGTVTAVGKDTVTIKNEAGETWTVLSTDNTRVRRDGQPGTIGGVQAGDEVVAVGMPDADKHEVYAMMVMDVSAAAAAKAKENLGKTYITGRITAINADNAQLTVMRADKVAQVITLDESTSLHKGGRMDPAAMQAAGLDFGGMGMGGPGGAGGGRRGGGAAPAGADAGEAITMADIKVGDTVVGLGSVKAGSFVPTDLRVQERPAGGPGGPGGGGRRGGAGGGAAPAGAPPQQ